MPEPAFPHLKPDASRCAHVRGQSPVAGGIAQVLRDEGWTLASEASAACWLIHVTGGREADATSILSDLRAFADSLDAKRVGGMLLILDLSHAASRAGEAPPPFAEALALRTLQAAVPLLALEFAPRLRVNAIGILPPCPQLPQGTPPADIAAALRFVIDAPALTGQMIALDGGRTALVPAPGLGTPDQT